MFMKKIIVLILLVITLSGCKAEYYCYENDILRGKTCIIQHTTPAQISYDCSNYSRNDFILKGDKCCAQNSNMFCYPAAKKYNWKPAVNIIVNLLFLLFALIMYYFVPVCSALYYELALKKF